MKLFDASKTEKINSKYFVVFVKIFLLYVFLEYVLLSLSNSSTITNIIKLFGDCIILVFFVFTLTKLKSIKLYHGQRLYILLAFVILAFVSTIKNDLGFIDLFLGIRSLFRYYIIFFLSYYYDIHLNDFKKISNFMIKSFYIEIILFTINYLLFNTINVLDVGYLPMAIYLNTVFSLMLYDNKFNLKNNIIIVLLFVQAFLSTSRLAVVGIIIQSMIYFLFIWKKSVKTKAITIFIIIIFAIMIFNFGPITNKITSSYSYNKLENTNFNPDSNFRVYLLTHFTEVSIQKTNLIGDGPNTFGSPEYHEDYLYAQGFDDRTIAYSSDSNYTVLLMCYGFIGLFLYYLLLYLLYSGTLPIYKTFLLPYLCFIVLASFTLPAFSMRISSFLMFTFFALTHNIVEINHESS